MFATTAPVFGAARPVLGSVARPRVSIAKAASASTASKPTRFRANKPHSDLATTRRNSSLGKRGDQLKAYGLKDFKNLPADLKSVNVGDMGDALSGDDRGERTDAVVGIGGCVSCAVMAYSLFVLQQTGCGLPPGPSGLFGAAEGISYVYVTGLVLYSAVKKVKTGSGLPAGPGGVLGLAEGLAYLLVVAGIGVGVLQFLETGALPNAAPVENGKCFSP
jgi:hypothetical protein